jgi:hypothetical protein
MALGLPLHNEVGTFSSLEGITRLWRHTHMHAYAPLVLHAQSRCSLQGYWCSRRPWPPGPHVAWFMAPNTYLSSLSPPLFFPFSPPWLHLLPQDYGAESYSSSGYTQGGEGKGERHRAWAITILAALWWAGRRYRRTRPSV